MHGCGDDFGAFLILERAMEWIDVQDRVPDERAEPYQVIVVCTKKMGGMYPDRGIRRFIQDWAVRRWPQNFTHWMEAMPMPEVKP